MSDIPEFWRNFDGIRRTLLGQISTNARNDREDWGGKRKRVTITLTENQMIKTADDRYCREAAAWIVAERESIAAEIEAAYPDIGKVIADGIRARPEPLKQEEEAV